MDGKQYLYLISGNTGTAYRNRIIKVVIFHSATSDTALSQQIRKSDWRQRRMNKCVLIAVLMGVNGRDNNKLVAGGDFIVSMS